MNWSERLNCLMSEQKRTGFIHNTYVQRLYYKLLNAIEKRDVGTSKKLIIKMGF